MWTLVYVKADDTEAYERFDYKQELIDFIKENIDFDECCEEDVLIFPPDTEMSLAELYE